MRLMAEMEDRGFKPDVVTFTSMMSSCDARAAKELMEQMRQRGLKASVVTYTALIGKLNDGPEVLEVLRQMEEEGISPTVATYSCAVKICAQAYDFPSAGRVMRKMKQKGVRPNIMTYAPLIKAHHELGSTFDVEAVLRHMLSQGVPPQGFAQRNLEDSLGAQKVEGLCSQYDLHPLGTRQILGRSQGRGAEQSESKLCSPYPILIAASALLVATRLSLASHAMAKVSVALAFPWCLKGGSSTWPPVELRELMGSEEWQLRPVQAGLPRQSENRFHLDDVCRSTSNSPQFSVCVKAGWCDDYSAGSGYCPVYPAENVDVSLQNGSTQMVLARSDHCMALGGNGSHMFLCPPRAPIAIIMNPKAGNQKRA
ncbi:unnamed protein product, partial [Effrenium voratum]